MKKFTTYNYSGWLQDVLCDHTCRRNVTWHSAGTMLDFLIWPHSIVFPKLLIALKQGLFKSMKLSHNVNIFLPWLHWSQPGQNNICEHNKAVTWYSVAAFQPCRSQIMFCVLQFNNSLAINQFELNTKMANRRIVICGITGKSQHY